MTTVTYPKPEDSWYASQRRSLNHRTIVEILKLTDDDVRRVRASGHLFANLADVANGRTGDNSVRILFCTWDDVEELSSIDGREWLMSFDHAASYLGAPGELDPEDPANHPWNDAFDAVPPDRIRAVLIQFLIDTDPIWIVGNEMVHRQFPPDRSSHPFHSGGSAQITANSGVREKHDS